MTWAGHVFGLDLVNLLPFLSADDKLLPTLTSEIRNKKCVIFKHYSHSHYIRKMLTIELLLGFFAQSAQETLETGSLRCKAYNMKNNKSS